MAAVMAWLTPRAGLAHPAPSSVSARETHVTTTPCPNLRDLFGDRFKIGHDPTVATRSEKRDPWMQTIPCRFGVIYPHGPGRLALEMDHHPSKARRVAAILDVRLHQDGEHEKTFTFPVELFEQVAQVVWPRRKYRSSSRQLDNLMVGTG
jgi:hypothetical protein